VFLGLNPDSSSGRLDRGGVSAAGAQNARRGRRGSPKPKTRSERAQTGAETPEGRLTISGSRVYRVDRRNRLISKHSCSERQDRVRLWASAASSRSGRSDLASTRWRAHPPAREDRAAEADPDRPRGGGGSPPGPARRLCSDPVAQQACDPLDDRLASNQGGPSRPSRAEPGTWARRPHDRATILVGSRPHRPRTCGTAAPPPLE